MLGWMLGGRGGENAPDAVGDGDTTQIDQPDTPAPVFAARALKSALFGTPAPRSDIPTKPRARGKAELVVPSTGEDLDSPMKPQGILLTPGTATSRRKRVSFNHDALTTTKSISPFESQDGTAKRTRLTEVLEKARRKGTGAAADKVNTAQNKADTDSEWEEEDDDDNDDDNDDDVCNNDFTLDLNEPHSQSGKYWKGEFERYRTEAAAELEKLVKYKQRAKSYAREKDVEAMQLAEKLREEQEKVIAMEKKIAENASQMAAKQRESSSSETAELLATLTKQTALATESRHRVQELEERLDELLKGREEDHDFRGKRRRTTMPSPITQKALLETQRELRRARTQLKELDTLREQVSSLKAQLRRAGQRDPLASGGANGAPESSTARDLRALLRKAREESAQKDEELAQLKHEYEVYRDESEAHDADTKAVLERAHAKISDLKKEIKILKVSNGGAQAQPRSWQLTLDGAQLSKDDLSVQLPMRHTSETGVSRRSLDLADLERGPLLNAKTRTLREKYQEGATNSRDQGDDDVVITAITPAILAERPDLAKPRWQPFVPRSPRNRAYAEESLSRRISTNKSKSIAAPDLGYLKSGSRSKDSRSAESGATEVELLQNRLARLGGSDSDQDRGKKGTLVLSTNTRSALPPERRAAALARIEKRMADRALRREGYDKENLRP